MSAVEQARTGLVRRPEWGEDPDMAFTYADHAVARHFESDDSAGPSVSWCHNGTTKRMNLRDLPEDVCAALVEAAE